jgi:RNA ligase
MKKGIKMRYKFPEIRTINDVLPHIEGRPEFIVAEREFGTVINYVVAMADTFNMTGPDDIGGAIRRECRGLKFYLDGVIAARPFHKFFNIGEREETQPHLLDFTQEHTIMTKLDGSMIHPMKVGNSIRWMSKMGITEVGLQAEEFVSLNAKYQNFAEWCIDNTLTPIFEWCSQKQKIVIDYPEDSLTLLAVRNNITGEYKKLS